MKNKLEKVFENIHASQNIDEKIMNKTIYNSTKMHIPKYAIITILLATLIGFSFGVAKISEYVINIYTKSSDDGTFKHGSEKLTLSMTKKVKIKKRSELSCEDALNYYNIENNLGINLINYNPINKYEQEKCEIYKDEKSNIRRVKIYYNDEYTSDLVNQYNNKDNSFNNKKYLSLIIEFMTNYATHEDEDYFKEKTIIKMNNVIYGSKSNSDSDKSRIEEELLEDYHITKLNIDAKIVNWYGNNSKIEKVNKASTFCFFVYDGVYYSFMGYNMSKDEFINILENLEI